MPVTQPYLAATLANLRMNGMATLFQQLPGMFSAISKSGMRSDRAQAFISSYKSRALTAFNLQVNLAAQEAVAMALASATESDNKCATLALLIDGTPVDIARVENAAELTATVASGVDAGNTLQGLINQANSVLS